MLIGMIMAAAVATGQMSLPASVSYANGSADTVGDFRWTGKVTPNAWVRVRDVSGRVTVEAGTGSMVEITAHKSWRHGDPSRVRIVAQRSGPSDADVIVCALWDEHDSCDATSERASHHSDTTGDDENDVSVDFTVRLPKGANIDARTVNGDIQVAGVAGRVESATVNGSVTAESLGGSVAATTVNGDVRARVASLAGASQLDYSTVNGSVIVYLLGNPVADIDLKTVHGSVTSDFPLIASGELDPHHMRGTIGGGGGIGLHMQTVNGSVALHRGEA